MPLEAKSRALRFFLLSLKGGELLQIPPPKFHFSKPSITVVQTSDLLRKFIVQFSFEFSHCIDCQRSNPVQSPQLPSQSNSIISARLGTSNFHTYTFNSAIPSSTCHLLLLAPRMMSTDHRRYTALQAFLSLGFQSRVMS